MTAARRPAAAVGMGLAISRSIVEAHGGRMRAIAVPDGGVAFHVLLPARGLTAAAR